MELGQLGCAFTRIRSRQATCWLVRERATTAPSVRAWAAPVAGLRGWRCISSSEARSTQGRCPESGAKEEGEGKGQDPRQDPRMI